jgi:FKBP-type peptidyl-prolyl cis-trans isomerase FkpA
MSSNFFKLLIPLMLLMGLAFSSCRKDDPEVQAAKDRKKILEYIADNSLDAHEHESGIFYVIHTPGTGGNPTINSRVRIKYKGYLLNGDVFDSSSNLEITLKQTILGWQHGIPLFKRGGTGMLLIPSGLGYGPWARPRIPANSVLIFDIELIDFIN